MRTSHALARDLAFIREGVEHVDRPLNCAPIYFLWAGIVPVGFALTDLAAPAAAWFWTIAGPVGGLISAWLGFHAARRAGQIARANGLREAAHWGGMLVGIFLVQTTAALGTMDPKTGAAVILLIVGIGYFYAGLYLAGPLLWIAALQVAAFAVVILSASPPWTLIGLSVGAGLVAVGVHDQRRPVAPRRPVLVQS